MNFTALLKNMRTEEGISLDQLALGIMSASQLARIEKGERSVAKVVRDRLLERLGVARDLYENLLDLEDYREWERQKDILHAVREKQTKEAEQLLSEYEESLEDDENIRRQFYLVMLADIQKKAEGQELFVRKCYRDTLRYNTESKIAVILGPSNIVSDNNHIYSERGFYNTMTEQAELLDRSVLTNQGKKLVGDSLFYDRIIGYGEAFDNVKMTDSINKNMLTGDYCFYNELTDSAFATKRAVAIDYSQGPDSLFMHGDTLQLVSYNLNTDSVFRLMKAYHKVRMYRTDVQGVCDSLVYNSKDSCMTMYTDPILWNEGLP